MLRICRRNGWSIEQQWDTLSEWEQNEWLADDLYLTDRANALSEQLTKGEHSHYTPEVHAMLMLSSW